MKKLLYGTTALAASALVLGATAGTANAAERIKLGLGGYFNGAFVFGDADNASQTGLANRDLREHGFSQESEVYFFGKTTLDNGIEFGVMFQLEGETSADQMDNTYIWMESGFGRVEFGEEWGPSLKMSYGTVGDALAGPGGFGDFGSQTPHNNYNGVGINTYGGDAGIVQRPIAKLTYYTPRMAGFQVGVSYAPTNINPANRAAGLQNVSNVALLGEVGGVAGSELFDIGANFVQKFGDFDVALFGSWFTSESEPAVVGAPSPRDVDGYSLGGQVGFMGFRFGGRYTKLDDQFGPGGAPAASGVGGTDTKSWRLGVDYRTGPWMVGVAYHETRASRSAVAAGAFGAVGSTAGFTRLETDYWSIGARYTLGPGITLYGGVSWYDYQVSSPVVAPVLNRQALEGEPVVGIIGTVLQF